MTRKILPTQRIGDDFCDDEGVFTARYPWVPEEYEIAGMDDQQLRALEGRCRYRAKKQGLKVLKRGDSYWLAPNPFVDEDDLSDRMNLVELCRRMLPSEFNLQRVPAEKLF
jgi:hypothetical protein